MTEFRGGPSGHHYSADDDDTPPWLAELQASYPQRNSGYGSQLDGMTAKRLLDENQDPVEARALSRMRESQRQAARDGRTSVYEALSWIRQHDPRHLGPE